MYKKIIIPLYIIFMFTSCENSNSPVKDNNDRTFKTIINDNFDHHDQTIWQKANWANGNPFYNAWCEDQVSFNLNVLTLTLEKKDCQTKTHASGEYRTFDTYKYGRYTVKFIASDINGTVSSFFTYTGPSEGTQWDEIDMEILGKDPTKLQINYWRNGHEHPITINLGFDASRSMHKYSFIWNEKYIKWYVDDSLVYTVNENNLNNNDSLPINPGKIMINLWAATGINNWSGTYEDNTTIQTKYDFVKYESF